jgi:hypothetical protein
MIQEHDAECAVVSSTKALPFLVEVNQVTLPSRPNRCPSAEACPSGRGPHRSPRRSARSWPVGYGHAVGCGPAWQVHWRTALLPAHVLSGPVVRSCRRLPAWRRSRRFSSPCFALMIPASRIVSSRGLASAAGARPEPWASSDTLAAGLSLAYHRDRSDEPRLQGGRQAIRPRWKFQRRASVPLSVRGT